MATGDRTINIKYIKPGSNSNLVIKINDAIKLIFDVVVSSIVLLLFSPFYLLIIIAIKRDSPGPIIYRGLRLGRYGKPFNILKFRTMVETPESRSGPRITAHDDSRITEIGRWLRDTKINEFPQFWNVLKGDMSLVGPRPEDPEIVKTWPRNIWNEVLSVRPGITSPASVRYHNEEKLLTNCDVEQMYLSELSPNKARLDQLYVRYRSFLLDLDTIFWTVLTFLPKVSAHKLPEELLFLGIFSRVIRRFLNWFTIDLLTSLVAFVITGLIFRVRGPLNIGETYAIVLTFAYAVLFSGMGVVFGTNRIRWSKANPTDYFDLIPSWILATTIAVLIGIFINNLPGELILIASVFSLFGYITIRSRSLIVKHFLERSIFFHRREDMIKERVLIIGLGASAQHTAWLFEHLMNSKLYHIVGFVDNDLITQGARYFGSKVIGKWEDIPDLVQKHDIGLVILADYRVNSRDYNSIKDIIAPTNVRLVVMPDILASINHLVDRQSILDKNKGEHNDKMNSKCIDCLAQHAYSSLEGLN